MVFALCRSCAHRRAEAALGKGFNPRLAVRRAGLYGGATCNRARGVPWALPAEARARPLCASMGSAMSSPVLRPFSGSSPPALAAAGRKGLLRNHPRTYEKEHRRAVPNPGLPTACRDCSERCRQCARSCGFSPAPAVLSPANKPAFASNLGYFLSLSFRHQIFHFLKRYQNKGSPRISFSPTFSVAAN